MNFLVSFRNPPFVGWVAIDEFEDLFSRLCDAQIATPARRHFEGLVGKIGRRYRRPFDAVRLDANGELLLVVARKPSDLTVLRDVQMARRRFRYIAGYVIDSYFTEDFTREVKDFDHVFCTSQVGVDAIRHRFGGSSSVLWQGFDCLNWTCLNPSRSVDVIGFGRQPPTFHRAFQKEFHRARSGILYLHSPIGASVGREVLEERPMMLKLLQQSKLSLAFNLLSEPEGSRPRALDFVTSRWFESLTCGCLVIGKRPIGPTAEAILCWPDATIDLPDDPAEASSTIVQLSSNLGFLEKVRMRNIVEMCHRHDWRYRIRDIYLHFGLKLPTRLVKELAELDLLLADLNSTKRMAL